MRGRLLKHVSCCMTDLGRGDVSDLKTSILSLSGSRGMSVCLWRRKGAGSVGGRDWGKARALVGQIK